MILPKSSPLSVTSLSYPNNKGKAWVLKELTVGSQVTSPSLDRSYLFYVLHPLDDGLWDEEGGEGIGS